MKQRRDNLLLFKNLVRDTLTVSVKRTRQIAEGYNSSTWLFLPLPIWEANEHTLCSFP